MNYRQWKKQYMKLYGNNPGIEVDKRKQAKFMKRAVIGIDLACSRDYGEGPDAYEEDESEE